MIRKLTPQQLADLWDINALPLTDDQKADLPILIRWLDRRKADPVSRLLRGQEAGEEVSGASTEEFAQRIIARFHPAKRGVELLQIACKVIDRANALKVTTLCPPPVPFLLKRQQSPFAESRWNRLDLASQLRRHLGETILGQREIRTKGNEKLGVKVAVGRAILASILHGGLVAEASIEALAQRLAAEPCPIEHQGQRAFVNLSLGYRGQGNAEFRRWFPDALSALLLLGLQRAQVRQSFDIEPDAHEISVTRARIWGTIKSFLQASGMPTNLIPKSLSALLDAVRLDFDSRLPPILVNYAARAFVSHSLKPEVWARINGLSPVADSGSSFASLEKAPVPIRLDVDKANEPEPRWLSDLRMCFSAKTRAEIVEATKSLLSSSTVGFEKGSNGELFTQFALTQIGKRNAGGDPIAISTARANSITVAKRLGGLLGETRAAELSGPEWIELYQDALDDAESPGVRRKLAAILVDLHKFLERERGLDAIDAGEVLGIGTGLVPVDANIITPDEFAAIRSRFSEAIAVGPLAGIETIAWLVITLSYRCGLRRMEVLKLELADLCDKDPVELLVRPTAARRLKTKNSTRKIPLYALLEPDEIKALLEWLANRRTEESVRKYSDFLFSAPTRNHVFVPQDTLFNMLHKIMREVTGDYALRFHHLRHSFASWTFLRLMRADLSCVVSTPLPGRLTEPFINDSSKFRTSLYGNDNPTRRHGYAVASLLGHSGPEVSFEHYVHFVDVILADYLSQDSASPSKAVIIKASEVARSSAHRAWKTGGSSALVHFRWRQIQDAAGTTLAGPESKPKIPKKPKKAGTQDSDEAEISKNSVAAIDLIWRMLTLRARYAEPAKELASRFGYPEADIEAYLKRATEIAEFRSGKQDTGYRHHFETRVIDEPKPTRLERIPVPIKPQEERDLIVLATLAPKLRDLISRRRELALEAIGYYITNAWSGNNAIIFKTPEEPDEARLFLEFLKELGIERDRILFICYDASMRSRPFAAWKTALKLSWRDQDVRMKPPNGREIKGCQWLGIRPQFERGDDQTEFSPAFRYLMVMSAIEFGWAEKA